MKTHSFDIILIYSSHRKHNYFLTIAYHLSKKFKIGFIDCGRDQKMAEQTDGVFKSFLKENSVPEQICKNIECKLLIIPTFSYTSEFLNLIKDNVQFKKGISPCRPTGLNYENIKAIIDIGIKTFLPFSKSRFIFESKKDIKLNNLINDLEILSLGSPYKKYPIVDIPTADYIIAYPTQLSFTDDSFIIFLNNIIQLIKNIPKESIYFKMHNARDYGNRLYSVDRVKRYIFLPVFLLSLINKFFVLSSKLSWLSNTKLFNKLKATHIDILNTLITKKTIPLYKVTPYANLGIEFFLPSIRKGLITGKSTCVWFALHDELPVFNCDDYNDIGNETISSNIKFYGVPPCKGSLTFDKELFKKISPDDKNGDIIRFIKNALSKKNTIAKENHETTQSTPHHR